MGRKKKEPILDSDEPGNVLDGVGLSQNTADTWAVQFRFQGKPCSKLLYGTKQTAASVRELVAIWLCFKASDASSVATELQQLQHGYEHYSFLIEALKHSRSVEALWKVVGKFCRGEFEVRSALKPGQPRGSADESTGRSPVAGRIMAPPEGDTGAVNSQGDAPLQPAHAAAAGGPPISTATGATLTQGAPSTAGNACAQGLAGGVEGDVSSAAGLKAEMHDQQCAAGEAAMDAAHPMAMMDHGAAAAAAAAAAGLPPLPSTAGFPVSTAAAAAALQAALLYSRGTDPAAAGMLPVLWQQQFTGLPQQQFHGLAHQHFPGLPQQQFPGLAMPMAPYPPAMPGQFGMMDAAAEAHVAPELAALEAAPMEHSPGQAEGGAEGAQALGMVDGAQCMGVAEGVQEMGSVEAAQDVGSAEAAQDVGSAEAAQDVGMAEAAELAGGPAEAALEAGGTDATQELGSAEELQQPVGADGVQQPGGTGAEQELGGAAGVQQPDGAEGPQEPGGAEVAPGMAGDDESQAAGEAEHGAMTGLMQPMAQGSTEAPAMEVGRPALDAAQQPCQAEGVVMGQPDLAQQYAGMLPGMLDHQAAAAAAAAAATAASMQLPEEVQRQLLAGGGKSLDDAAAQGLLLWWQHAVAGGYAAAPAHVPPAPTGAPSPKRQRT